jgi:phage/plasmid-associated DNA primase
VTRTANRRRLHFKNTQAIVSSGKERAPSGSSSLVVTPIVENLLALRFFARCSRRMQCARSPMSLGSEYQRAALRGKLVNLVSEMPERELLDAAPLKALVGGDIISAREIYRAPVTFLPTAGHVFATNTLPAIRDTSEATHKRLLVLEFNNRFAQGAEDKGTTHADPTIAHRIIEAERNAIISWCIDGAARSVSNSFVITEPPSSRRAISELRTEKKPKGPP